MGKEKCSKGPSSPLFKVHMPEYQGRDEFTGGIAMSGKKRKSRHGRQWA